MSIIMYTDGQRTKLFSTDQAGHFSGSFCPIGTTGGATSKEDLYLTNKGDWIKNVVTLADKHTSTYAMISGDEAHAWLKKHGYTEAATRYFAHPKGGRPPIGDRLTTRVPARTHREIQEVAAQYGEDVPDAVRRLLEEALTHRRTISASSRL